MKKAVMIIAQKDFRDEELLKPRAILEKNGISVTVASTVLGPVKGLMGAEVQSGMRIKDINPEDFDLIVFVGGGGAQQYWDDPVAHELARKAYQGGKLVAAICIAPVILGKAGLLKGKRATVWTTNAGQLKVSGAEYTGKNVEKDGTIITAAGPFAAQEFGEELVKALKGEKEGA